MARAARHAKLNMLGESSTIMQKHYSPSSRKCRPNNANTAGFLLIVFKQIIAAVVESFLIIFVTPHERSLG